MCSLQLTHLPLDKMAAILADDIFIIISIQISLKFVPNGPIDNKSALVQVMAWRRTGDKPLPEAMMTQFTDAYMRHGGDEFMWPYDTWCDSYTVGYPLRFSLFQMFKLLKTWSKYLSKESNKKAWNVNIVL